MVILKHFLDKTFLDIPFEVASVIKLRFEANMNKSLSAAQKRSRVFMLSHFYGLLWIRSAIHEAQISQPLFMGLLVTHQQIQFQIWINLQTTHCLDHLRSRKKICDAFDSFEISRFFFAIYSNPFGQLPSAP